MSSTAQLKMPLLPVVRSGPVVRSYESNLIGINGHMPSDDLIE